MRTYRDFTREYWKKYLLLVVALLIVIFITFAIRSWEIYLFWASLVIGLSYIVNKDYKQFLDYNQTQSRVVGTSRWPHAPEIDGSNPSSAIGVAE